MTPRKRSDARSAPRWVKGNAPHQAQRIAGATPVSTATRPLLPSRLVETTSAGVLDQPLRPGWTRMPSPGSIVVAVVLLVLGVSILCFLTGNTRRSYTVYGPSDSVVIADAPTRITQLAASSQPQLFQRSGDFSPPALTMWMETIDAGNVRALWSIIRFGRTNAIPYPSSTRCTFSTASSCTAYQFGTSNIFRSTSIKPMARSTEFATKVADPRRTMMASPSIFISLSIKPTPPI